MATLSTIMFYLGVAFTIAGFFISNSDQYPWIERTIASDFHYAKAGLKALETDKELKKGQLGFPEIAKIIKAHISALPDNAGKEQTIKESDLLRISNSMGSSIQSAEGVTILLGVSFEHNGQQGRINDLNSDVIRDGVAALGKSPIQRWNAAMFWIGILLMIGSRIVDNLKDGKSILS